MGSRKDGREEVGTLMKGYLQNQELILYYICVHIHRLYKDLENGYNFLLNSFVGKLFLDFKC